MSPESKSRKANIADLERQLQEKTAAITALEQANKRLEDRLKEAESEEAGPTPLTELEETLKRLARIETIDFADAHGTLSNRLLADILYHATYLINVPILKKGIKRLVLNLEES